METLPLPPEPAPLPPAPLSAHRQVLAAYDRIAEAGRPELWTILRPCEDVLVDAKAVDERVRAGEPLPLAGLLAAVADPLDVAGLPTSGRPDTSATAVRRLTEAGAVVLGKIVLDRSGAAVVALGLVDVTIGTGMAACDGVVGLAPTPGLVPVTGVPDRVGVFARTVADGQRVLAAMTGPDPADPSSRAWPSSVRLSAGERPRLAIPVEAASGAFRTAVEDLLAAGATVETVGSTGFLDHTAKYDALLLPLAPEHGELLGFPVVTVPGVSVVARLFEDQIALDIAAYLHAEQIRNPYPDTGIDLVVFGAHLRGQPLNTQLTDLGARFLGEVETAGSYRMVALPTSPPQPGILPVAGGAPLAGERWTISPAGLGSFLDGLPQPMRPGEIELADGSTAMSFHCGVPAGAHARDITRFDDWRAYLRHLTATRPMSC
ncbi:hypothetical protein LWP59_11150 [Amycolatopsis acidiphila]|uniref:Amidase n=1 Tax=Amycolatopsis acidiphila TaxID=715473 RepID=A0A557ZY88_9PSEU|nr:amidase family protein [Amycolatopsis acidiphila]TVT16964.1 hypothetical protein FNH06_33275 [Amycolatopsis acidiphila]UIJ62132.1 hypothetical protein LWP59_11150 [Amycolatopsis acidiphila]GHG92024.1 amidase [Amycolatopsis acidiphila]